MGQAIIQDKDVLSWAGYITAIKILHTTSYVQILNFTCDNQVTVNKSKSKVSFVLTKFPIIFIKLPLYYFYYYLYYYVTIYKSVYILFIYYYFQASYKCLELCPIINRNLCDILSVRATLTVSSVFILIKFTLMHVCIGQITIPISVCNTFWFFSTKPGGGGSALSAV